MKENFKDWTSPNIRKPNFFLIGAPKSGTTALFANLKDHPEIFIPNQKELHYLATDFSLKFRKRTGIKSFQNYQEQYFNIPDSKIRIGDCSVTYLYSTKAIDNILSFQPHAKFLVILRNPVEMVYSVHSQLLYSQYEDQENFESAWRMQESRRNGKNIPKRCGDSIFLQYKDFCSIGTQLKRVRDKVPEQNLLVLFYDDLKTHSAKSYQDTLDFLGVEIQKTKNNEIINPNKKNRSLMISTLLEKIQNSTPGRIKQGIKSIKAFVGLHDYSMLNYISKLNRKEFKRKPLPQDLIEELKIAFTQEIELVESITKRDLGHWYK